MTFCLVSYDVLPLILHEACTSDFYQKICDFLSQGSRLQDDTARFLIDRRCIWVFGLELMLTYGWFDAFVCWMRCSNGDLVDEIAWLNFRWCGAPSLFGSVDMFEVICCLALMKLFSTYCILWSENPSTQGLLKL